MHEVRFPNICIQSNIIYYTLPVIKIIVLAIKAVVFLWVRQTLSNIFARHYGDINGFFIISDYKIYYFIVEEVKRKAHKH